MSTSSVTLGVGETYTVSQSTNSGSYAKNFTWSSSNSSVATIQKTTANQAKITAKGVGTATITVRTYNGKTATCRVTVKKAPTSIKISKPSNYIGEGESVTITESTSSGSYSNSITWSSSNSSVISIKKGSGNKAVITANGTGSATISVKTYNGVTTSYTASVKKAPSSIYLSENVLNLEIGDRFTITGKVNSGTYCNTYTWTSTNSSVGSVSSNTDNKTVVTAKAAGTTYIKVTTYNGKTDTCKVVVRKDTAEEYINEVLRLTNEERKKEGLPALVKRTDVDKVAAIRAEEISVEFSHTRPNGKDFYSIVSENNISYTRLGENIAAGHTSPEEVVESWMNSTGHKRNILNSNYKGMGVGYYVKDGIAYWVQIMIA